MAEQPVLRTGVARLHQSRVLRVSGAVLCAGVVAIHVADQGGFTGMADPVYKGYLYYALEAGATLAAILLIAGRTAISGWVLALGVSMGPASLYVMSRSIGLPDYSEDVGNWTEPLGIASLVVEGSLLICALLALAADHRVAAAELRAIGHSRADTTEGLTCIDVTKARNPWAQAIEAAQTQPVLLERRGATDAVMISPTRYHELITAFDRHAERPSLFD